MIKICGIYKITSPNKKIYIGQSINIELRKRYYKNASCKSQSKIYNSLKKHGWEKHKFEIIDQCLPEDLNEKEKYYVDLFQTFNSKYGMNLKDGGGNRVKMSNESRKKIGAAHRGKKMSEESRTKMSISGLGQKNSKSHNENIRLAKIGKKRNAFSKEWIENMRKGQTGRKHSEETKSKMSMWQKGVKKGSPSEETKIKLSLANKGRKRSEEFKLQNKHNKGKHFNTELNKFI